MSSLAGARVLITGGAGFIGSRLVRHLLDHGAEVTVVDNLVNGRRENLDGLTGDRLQLIVADIRESRRMAEVMVGVDVVFHLACLGVRHSIHSPNENHEVNATATLRLLSAARDGNARRFVYVSSSEVYGTALWVPMSEEHPTFPVTVYGAAKLAGECYTRAFYRTYGYPTVVVRPFNAYGERCHHEGDSGEVIPRFMLHCLSGRPMRVFGDGTQTRDFTYVADTVWGILRAGFVDGAVGHTINLGTGREITISDLAREVATAARVDDAVSYDAPRPGDVLRLYADITKARKLLGFNPQVTLQDGLRRLKDWYLSLSQSPEVLLKQVISRNWEGAEIAR